VCCGSCGANAYSVSFLAPCSRLCPGLIHQHIVKQSQRSSTTRYHKRQQSTHAMCLTLLATQASESQRSMSVSSLVPVPRPTPVRTTRYPVPVLLSRHIALFTTVKKSKGVRLKTSLQNESTGRQRGHKASLGNRSGKMGTSMPCNQRSGGSNMDFNYYSITLCSHQTAVNGKTFTSMPLRLVSLTLFPQSTSACCSLSASQTTACTMSNRHPQS
jgi:hypothetical protein